MMQYSIRRIATIKACGFHLIVSCCIALLAAVIVFLGWFPFPYRELAGGQFLFWIMIGVDVACGPLLTGVLYNPEKSRRELMLDLSLVALVQFGALLYGMHTISLARPVAVVYEVDRFVVVTAAQLTPAALAQAKPAYRNLPWFGSPWLLGIRSPKDSGEVQQNLALSLQGLEPSARPGWWQLYELSRTAVQAHMKPVSTLYPHKPPLSQSAIDASVRKTGLSIGQLHYLPLVSQKSLDQWIVLLDAQANIVGYASVGGFD